MMRNVAAIAGSTFLLMAAEAVSQTSSAEAAVQIEVEWSVAAGGEGLGFGRSIAAASSNGMVVAGTTTSFRAGFEDAYLIRLDGEGEVIWERTIGTAAQDYAEAVQPTTDGGFIVAGYTGIQPVSFDAMLARTDEDGQVIWQRTHGGTGTDMIHDVQQTDDGGFILVGETSSFGSGGFDIYLIKTDDQGNMEWQRTFDVDDDNGTSIDTIPEQGFVIAGYAGDGSIFPEFDALLLRTDLTGDLIWQRTFDAGVDDRGHTVRRIGDEGFVMAGLSQSRMALWKTNTAGNPVWERVYGGDNTGEAMDVRQTADGGYLLGGISYRGGDGAYEMFVVKTDDLGLAEWEQTVGGPMWEWCTAVYENAPGRYTLAGTTNSFGAGGYDLYAVGITATTMGDVNADGHVDIDDVFAVLSAWGPCDDPPADCPEDLDANGVVDIDDLFLVLSHWS
ncbi:MAG: hypothetical protein JSV91_03325 [Phycisphaerales bacterium]|nr:MAG: hypothetical protein JSV91_03325 [Phycisphaerales bacterium]